MTPTQNVINCNENYVVIDTETNGTSPYKGAKLISFQLYFPATGETVHYPMAHGQGNETQLLADWHGLSWTDKRKKAAWVDKYWRRYRMKLDFGNYAHDGVKRLFELERQGYTFVFHNAKFDLHFLAQELGFAPVKVRDTMIGCHLLLEDWRNSSLKGNRQLKWQAEYWGFEDATLGETKLQEAIDKLSSDFADYVVANCEEKLPEKRIRSYCQFDSKKDMWRLPRHLVETYSKLDVVLTWKLFDKLTQLLETWDNNDLWRELDAVSREVAFEMERTGMTLKLDMVDEQIAKLEAEAQQIAERYEGVNLSSPKQLMKLLLNEGALVANTARATLEEYRDEHEVVSDVLDYRHAMKEGTTYLKKWRDNADAHSKIRFSFDVCGTVTGRWSSSGDAGNGQNIPERKGYEPKKVIVPPEGYVIMAHDYSTLELRLAVYVAEILLGFGNREMYSLFESGADMHAYTRDSIGIRQVVYGNASSEAILAALKEPLEGDLDKKVAKLCRQIGKTMNFGLLYGGGAGMLSRLLKLETATSATLVTEWRQLYPAFTKALEHYQKLGSKWRPKPDGTGSFLYVTQPISGRHRHFDKYPLTKAIKEEGRWISIQPRQDAQRKAWNSIVQGLAGYICSVSALRIARELAEVKMFAQIHDAIESFVPLEKAQYYRHAIDRIMTDWDITPSLKTESVIGYNWHDMKGDLPLVYAELTS